MGILIFYPVDYRPRHPALLYPDTNTYPWEVRNRVCVRSDATFVTIVLIDTLLNCTSSSVVPTPS